MKLLFEANTDSIDRIARDHTNFLKIKLGWGKKGKYCFNIFLSFLSSVCLKKIMLNFYKIFQKKYLIKNLFGIKK